MQLDKPTLRQPTLKIQRKSALRTISKIWLALCVVVSVAQNGLTIETSLEANQPEKSADIKLATSAADWFPESTQGFIRVVNLPKFIERWNKTELGVLGNDERLKEFWNDQRIEIEKRFANAGWQLNFHLEDIYHISSGQAAIAWISKPQETQKPFSVALVLDINSNDNSAKKLLQRVDKELKAQKASYSEIDYQGESISRYILPRGPGAIVIHESLYAISGDQLFAADELSTIKSLIDAQQGKSSNSLAKLPLYTTSMSKLSLAPNDPTSETDVEYFVRPIGLAKLLRSISGKPVASQTDVLKVLENQGFTKIEAVCGKVSIAAKDFDVFHNAFVLTTPPLPIPVQVLDFPNLAGSKIPGWVAVNSSSFLSLAWNAKDAFWKVETIVDDMAGQKGVFASVIDGIQTDPVGPQIDIKRDVLPFLTPEIYTVGDTVEPITPDSRRSLIAIRVNDPDGKLASGLERGMKNEPDKTVEDFQGYRIWKVERPPEGAEQDADNDDFGFGKKSPKSGSKKEEEKPLLSNWAITIYSRPDASGQVGGSVESYLMFASHADMIKEAITRGQSIIGESPLVEEPDVQRILAAIQSCTLGNATSMWQINRTDKAFEMQYELFRQDKLPQSRSMLATILDRILRPKDEIKSVDQKVKGDKLPPFDAIKSHLMPGGSHTITQPDGWSFTSFILSNPVK